MAPEFLKVDWRQASGGDAAKGRKLFGSLGCVKCHAITADQKGGGAQSEPGGQTLHRALRGGVDPVAE